MSVLTSQQNNRQHTLNIAPVEATFVFGIPAAVALICALILRDGSWFSGLWFVYSTSRDVALCGVLLSLGVVATVRHTASGRMLCLMGASIAGAAILLGYAIHLEAHFR